MGRDITGRLARLRRLISMSSEDPFGLFGDPDELRSRGRDVEVLINNAGYGSAGRFQDLDGEKETLMVRTNCEAVVALCAAFVPPMVDRGRGAVLNVASIAAYLPLPYQATYSAT